MHNNFMIVSNVIFNSELFFHHWYSCSTGLTSKNLNLKLWFTWIWTNVQLVFCARLFIIEMGLMSQQQNFFRFKSTIIVWIIMIMIEMTWKMKESYFYFIFPFSLYQCNALKDNWIKENLLHSTLSDLMWTESFNIKK